MTVDGSSPVAGVLLDSAGPHRRALAGVLALLLGERVLELPEKGKESLAEVRRALSGALHNASYLILNPHARIDIGKPAERDALFVFYEVAKAGISEHCRVILLSPRSRAALEATPAAPLLANERTVVLRAPLNLPRLVHAVTGNDANLEPIARRSSRF